MQTENIVAGADVVMELLNVCPEIIQLVDENGNTPLHSAASAGHREITAMLLKLEPRLAEKYNSSGFTPLHLAAMNYKFGVFQGFVMMAVSSFQCLTKEGETVFHVAAKHGQYDALILLIRLCNGMDLFNCQDRHGNTILHLAAYEGHHRVR